MMWLHIDSADVFIGGTGVDTAKALFGFQDYKFDDVAPGDTAHDAMVDTALVNGAVELGKTTGEVTALKADLLNLTPEPEKTDPVQAGGDPGAPGVATSTNWHLSSADSTTPVMDSVAIVQAENIEFQSGPDITIDASIGTAAGSLAEKTNIASGFKAHTVT